jgi:hypothetical protein
VVEDLTLSLGKSGWVKGTVGRICDTKLTWAGMGTNKRCGRDRGAYSESCTHHTTRHDTRHTRHDTHDTRR